MTEADHLSRYSPEDRAKFVDQVFDDSWTESKGGPIRTLRLLSKNNGFFEVPLLTFCYVDYLSQLYRGQKTRSGKFMAPFIQKFFHRSYKSIATDLVTMYRNGLIHQYEPVTLMLYDGELISWALSCEESRSSHLQVVPIGAATSICISAPQLVDDFVEAVNRFRAFVQSSDSHRLAFLAAHKLFLFPQRLGLQESDALRHRLSRHTPRHPT